MHTMQMLLLTANPAVFLSGCAEAPMHTPPHVQRSKGFIRQHPEAGLAKAPWGSQQLWTFAAALWSACRAHNRGSESSCFGGRSACFPLSPRDIVMVGKCSSCG